MPNASLSIDGTEVISKVSGTITQTFPGPNHTFTVKAENSPIAGANYNTSDNATSDQLAIYNGATKLWGINESGWVQQPNIPAFSAYGRSAGSGNFTYSAGNTVVFDQGTRYNIGNCYDLSNSRFTAPIDGIYFFSVSAFNNTASTLRVSIASSNGGRVFGQGQSSAGTDYRTSGVIFLYAGDYVFVQVSYDGTVIYHAIGHNEFNGCLIG